MHDERLERRVWAFDDRLAALDKIQHVHAAGPSATATAASVVRNFAGKPVPARLDKL